MRYIALLRGINVGGNNKVPMKELKSCFEALGFNNVQTYINSGNVIFEVPVIDRKELVDQCEQAVGNHFSFKVTCTVVSADELNDALDHAPEWWGKDVASSHNALFIIAPETPATIINEIGEINPEYERIASHGSIIFWSATVKTFGRTRLSKIVGTLAYRSITIRNINTTKKLAEISH